jgi:hypothetical protein
MLHNTEEHRTNSRTKVKTKHRTNSRTKVKKNHRTNSRTKVKTKNKIYPEDNIIGVLLNIDGT